MIGDPAMLLVVACLLHLAASLPLDGHKYLLDMDNGTLRSVRFADDADDTSKLDLSHLGIRALDKNTFDNVLGVQSLVLSDNLLASLPDFAFSNLTELRNLSLANNQIWRVRNLFIGLENLERVNISGNPIRHVYHGDLFGLTRSARIFTDANILWSISTGAFAKSLLEQPQFEPTYPEQPQLDKEWTNGEADNQTDREIVKLCLANGTVTSLQESSSEESKDCAPVNIYFGTMELQGLAIDAFQAGWYQLQADRNVQMLDLSDNRITAITSELLDGLPAQLTVNLARNAIRRISRVVAKVQLFQLELDDNPIELIDDDAFAGMTLTELHLRNCNQLDSLHFVASLSDTLSMLVVTSSRVSDIPDGAFAKLSNLQYLDLTGNRIESLRDDAFRGLTSLDKLELTENGLATIQPAALRGLTALRVLNLRDNSIRDLRNVTFAELTSLRDLDLSDNKITRPVLPNLPDNLDNLNLMRNEIETLQRGDFVRAPATLLLNDNPIKLIDDDTFAGTNLTELYLSNCSQLVSLHFVASLPDTLSVLVVTESRVSDIPDGAFAKLSNLRYLYLSGNHIESLRDDAFRGLTSLDSLELPENGLATIQPAALRGLTALRVLNLRNNSIRDLRNVTFAELTSLHDLDLSDNKITRPVLLNLPDNLDNLNLMRNEIETLQRGDFVRAPATTLLLNENNISHISRGAFDLPTLKSLHLTNNSLTAIDGDSFEGLGQLRNLWLTDNQISELTKGACKNLASLYVLDVSRNPFRRLDNGALHGLNTDLGSSVYVYENQLEEIQAGVFDDI